MASYTPVVGHHVIVADKANFYDGREAVVFKIANEGRSFWARVGNVEFLLARAHLRETSKGA
jgi:hypothetical protein